MYTEAEKEKYLNFVVNDYKEYFNKQNGLSWYSVTIKSLMDLAVKYEKDRMRGIPRLCTRRET